MHKIAQTHRHAHTAMCFIPLPCRIDKCWRDEDDCSRAGPGIDWYDMPQDNCGRQFQKQLGQAPPVPVIRLCIAKKTCITRRLHRTLRRVFWRMCFIFRAAQRILTRAFTVVIVIENMQGVTCTGCYHVWHASVLTASRHQDAYKEGKRKTA